MKREKFISYGLSKYVDFWNVGIAQSSTYETKMKPHVEYWENVLLHLLRPLPPQNTTLLKGSWPSSNWRSNYARASLLTVMDVVDPEDPIRVPYCGPKNMRPLNAYVAFRNLNVGDFVFMRLHDLDLVPLWMGKVEGDVIKDEKNEYFKMVRVQWWVLVKKRSNLDE